MVWDYRKTLPCRFKQDLCLGDDCLSAMFGGYFVFSSSIMPVIAVRNWPASKKLLGGYLIALKRGYCAALNSR